HRVGVVVIPLFGREADTSFVQERAAFCTTIELSDETDTRALTTELLSTAGGRRRAREVYPLPAICRLPSRSGHAAMHELIADTALVHVMRSYLAPCLDSLLDA